MSECYMCRRPLNRASGKVKFDGNLLCFQCAPQWENQRKQDALNAINANGSPAELFHIPLAVLPNPDNPQKNHLLGDLVFMDKGVCFVQLANFEAGQKNGAMWFGLIGSLIDASVYKKAKKQATDYYNAQVAQFAPHGLQGMLMGAPRLVFTPKNEIQTIKHGTFSGMRIETGNKNTRRVFVLEGGKKTYREFEPQIRDYMGI